MKLHSENKAMDQYLVEAVNALRTHQDLAGILDALAALSAAQNAHTDAESWNELLEKKQTLLDAIDEIAPADLFGRTRLLEGALAKAGRRDIAERINAMLEDNRKRFMAVNESEQAACTLLAAQVAEKRMALMTISRRRLAHSSYRNRAKTPNAQILDGVR